jgi:hypothetical protein
MALNALPSFDARDGHTTSTIVVAVTGMMPGNYGDVITGPGSGDYVHVTRNDNGSYRAVHVARRESHEGDNALRVAQFIANRIEL